MTHVHLIVIAVLHLLHLLHIIPGFFGSAIGDQQIQEPEIIPNITGILPGDTLIKVDQLPVVDAVPILVGAVFRIEGRISQSDIRGCNLLVQ